MASSLQQMAATITERSKTLINNDLKKILKEEGTSQTGNKAALQARVIGRTSLRSLTPGPAVASTPANFTLASHRQCSLQERYRPFAPTPVPCATPRRGASASHD